MKRLLVTLASLCMLCEAVPSIARGRAEMEATTKMHLGAFIQTINEAKLLAKQLKARESAAQADAISAAQVVRQANYAPRRPGMEEAAKPLLAFIDSSIKAKAAKAQQKAAASKAGAIIAAQVARQANYAPRRPGMEEAAKPLLAFIDSSIKAKAAKAQQQAAAVAAVDEAASLLQTDQEVHRAHAAAPAASASKAQPHAQKATPLAHAAVDVSKAAAPAAKAAAPAKAAIVQLHAMDLARTEVAHQHRSAAQTQTQGLFSLSNILMVAIIVGITIFLLVLRSNNWDFQESAREVREDPSKAFQTARAQAYNVYETMPAGRNQKNACCA